MNRRKRLIHTSLILTVLLFLAGCSLSPDKQKGEEYHQQAITNEPTKLPTPSKEPTKEPTPEPTPEPTKVPGPPDVTAPVLTVSGDEVTTVIARSEWIPFTYQAVDDHDGNLTDRVIVSGGAELKLCGEYQIIYEVADEAGNTASVVRTVEVIQPEEIVEEGNVIYLTFDDGPGKNTKKILDLLEQYQIKASFFICGSTKRDIIKQIYDAGHTLGAHCREHVYEKVYANDEAYFDDLEATMIGIYESTGAWTTFLRFPGGSSNHVSSFQPGIMTRLTAEVEHRGYQYFDWNVSSGDCDSTDPEVIFENMKKGVKNRTFSVMLAHPENKTYSYEALVKFIPWALENGYTFLPLSQTSPKCHHRIFN